MCKKSKKKNCVKVLLGGPSIQTPKVKLHYNYLSLSSKNRKQNLTNLIRTDIEKWVQDNVPDSCCVDMEDTCGWDYFKADNTNKADIHNEVGFTSRVLVKSD